MFHSDFDPPPRTQSVRGLLGIVAAVLLGIGFTVYGYLAEDGPGEIQSHPAQTVQPRHEVRPSTPQRAQRAPELRQRVDPVQHRSRPQAAASSGRSRSGSRPARAKLPPVSVPAPVSTPAASTQKPRPPVNQADASTSKQGRGTSVAPADA